MTPPDHAIDTDPRATLRELAAQARGLADLDRLLGVTSSPVPSLPPLRPLPAAAPPPLATSRAPARPVPPARPPAREPRPAPVAAAPIPSPPAPAADPPELAARRARNEQQLDELARRMAGCTRCKLHEGRTQLVFGQGDAAAELVFVGEGPGQQEDQQGLAFVGAAGELLTKMIQAMGLTRDEVFIANVVKCRPPDNRTPAPDEMRTCLPFLEEQLSIIRPRVICALGKTAAVGLGLLSPGEGIIRNRGQFKDWRGTPCLLTYHPAYLLRNPAAKKEAWADLQRLFPRLERRRPKA